MSATAEEQHSGSDRRWGPQEGARPPLGPRAVLIWWLATAAVLVTVVVAGVGRPGPLDDPRPGEQRSGLLFDPGEAPVVAVPQLPGGPLGRRPVFLLFDRRGYDPQRVQPVLAEVPDEFAFVVVVPRRPAFLEVPKRVSVVADPRRRLADAVELNQPVAGGFPVGYALIDAQRRVRYATLDPEYEEHALEVHIVTGPRT